MLLVAAALFMRAALPAGVMAEPRSDRLVVKLCAGGAMTIPLDRDRPADEDASPAAPCAFAAGGANAMPLPALAELPPPPVTPPAFGPFAAAANPPARFAALPPARAPPVSV